MTVREASALKKFMIEFRFHEDLQLSIFYISREDMYILVEVYKEIQQTDNFTGDYCVHCVITVHHSQE